VKRAGANASARASKAAIIAAVRDRARRSAARLRLRACANVFAHSRICFDAQRAARADAPCVDGAMHAVNAAASPEDDRLESRARGARRDQITLH